MKKAARSKAPPRPCDTRTQGTRKQTASRQKVSWLAPPRPNDRKSKGTRQQKPSYRKKWRKVDSPAYPNIIT